MKDFEVTITRTSSICVEAEFEVTITRTGSIFVEAENEKQAFEKVLGMSTSEIDRQSNLTGWEPSDSVEC